MTDRTKVWWETHLGDIIKIATIILAGMYAYVTVRADIDNLKEVRMNDKQAFNEKLSEIKQDLKEQRIMMMEMLRELRSNNAAKVPLE